MIPGTGVGALRIQQSQEAFSHSVATLLSVPTNATGANHSTMSAMLPSQDVT